MNYHRQYLLNYYKKKRIFKLKQLILTVDSNDPQLGGTSFPALV